MNFRIADTFTDSLARLTSEEQKLVKTPAFDLQMNPVNPGMLSSAGNPSMDNLAAIFHAIRERLNVNLEACSVAA